MARRGPGIAVGVALLALAGCVSVDYVGTSYAPTTAVDLFFSPDDVRRPYTVMGEVSAQVDVVPFVSPGPQLQEKLLLEARRRGANGMILGGITTREVGATQQTVGQVQGKKRKNQATYTETSTTSTDERAELRGTLIRYE